MLLVDNGNVAEAPGKAEVVLRVMGMDRYDAVGIGAMDAGLGEDYVRPARRFGTPVVRALPASDAIDPLARKLRTKELRGHTLGVTSLPPLPEGADAEAALDTAAQTLREYRKQCEFLVVLSQMGMKRDEELARRCGPDGPHAIIGNLDASVLKEPKRVGASLLLPTGPGGTHAGIADVVFPLWGEPRLENVTVNAAKGNTRTADEVGMLVSGYYEGVQKEFIAGVEPGLLAADVSGSVGEPTRCGKCHAVETARWAGTRHARAMRSLITHKRVVPECIDCHSVRFRDKRVFDLDTRVNGVSCTACHAIAGKGETSDCPDRAMPTRGQETCLPCHTEANSPQFNYARYVLRANHSQDTAPPTGGVDPTRPPVR